MPPSDSFFESSFSSIKRNNIETNHEDDPTNHGFSTHSSEVVILAPFCILAIGAFLRSSTKHLPIPYTMQLLLLGGLLGFFLRSSWDDTLQQSLTTLGMIDPHLMLHVFLPPLIFESAASMEWHLFARSKLYILSLAGPGLLMASFMTGWVVNLLVNASSRVMSDLNLMHCNENAWTFQTAMMLGVILSATDPVAVVALLKELGCKSSLAVSIEGESLLNDGTALVLYTILLKLTEGGDEHTSNLFDYLVTFVRMSIGGALFGLIFALLVVRWLRRIFNDALSEISITLSAAYLCFFTAEYFLHVSGVLAVVCLGLYFGNNGKTSVSPEVAHFLEEFWEILGFIGNTLIFVVAGIVIGLKLPIFPFGDFVQILILYVACTLIRAITVFLTFLICRGFGEDLDWKDQFVTVWAGLRGAVGLSLAMMVFGNEKICAPVRELIMFHTAGIVVLTVCINSVTMPYLLNFLQMDAVSPSKQLIYDQAMESLMNAGNKQEANIRSDHIFDSTIWEEARKYYVHVDCGSDQDISQNSDGLMNDKEIRRRILMITKKSYWRQFQDGILSQQSVRYLVHHTQLALDDDCELNEWSKYEALIRLSSTIDKGTDKLVASQASTDSERKRVKILNTLDSVPVIIIILILVTSSCILPFTLQPGSTSFLIIENATTAIFASELCLRIYCLRNWHPCAIDPYIAIDIVAVLLDILLLSAEDFLGGFSDYSKSIRGIRFLRLFRLLRFARIANRLRSAKVRAMDEQTTLLSADGFIKKFQRRMLYSQLRHGYEVATGFKVAREEVLSSLSNIETDQDALTTIRSSIELDLKKVRSALLDVQRIYSEIAASITTTVAARMVLNRQRHTIDDLHHEGWLDTTEFQKLKGSVEYKMKALTYHPPIINMPNKIDILGQIPWLECIAKQDLSNIAESFEDAVFTTGDVLVKQNEKSESVHVLARGTVAVRFETSVGEIIEIEELGMGSVFGEIAWALDATRRATIIATSPGLLFTISGSKLKEIANAYSDLDRKLWETCGRRLAENMLITSTNNRNRTDIRECVHE